MSTKTLAEIFEESTKELSDDISKQIRFLFVVKGEKPDITIKECKEFLKYSSDDEKEDANLNQKFRNKVLGPLRNYLTKREFSLASMKEAEGVWKQKNSTPENIKRREIINSKLPKVSRERTGGKAELDFEEILGIEEVNV